jgi:hypothetical protein
MINSSILRSQKVIQRKALFILVVLIAVLKSDGYGQVQNTMDNLIRRFKTYTTAVPREEIFISTDREEYIAGEVLWFSMWLFDRQSSHLTSHSRISYIEVLNPYNIPVCQARVILDKGFGYGQLRLPDTLSNGDYSIRAYTNWMRNFLPENCFQKEIKIYNAFKRGPFNKKILPAEQTTVTNPQPLYFDIGTRTTDTLELVIRRAGLNKSEVPDSFYLFIQTHGNINYTLGAKISDEFTRICIPAEALIPGINHITLFNSGGHPLSERYIYTPDPSMHYSADELQSTFSTRTNETIILRNEGHDIEVDSMFLSVSIAPLTTGERGPDASEYMLFGSEYGLLPGKILKEKGRFSNELIDSFLPEIKSNWLDWQKILYDSLPQMIHLAEDEVHFLSGSLLTNDNQTAPANEYVLLSSPGKNPVFKYAKTDDTGRFTFSMSIDEDVHDLIIQPDNNRKYKVSLESSFSGECNASEIRTESDWGITPFYIPDWSINYQVEKIFGASRTGKIISRQGFVLQKPLRFYGKPTLEVYLRDWAELSDMQEVFFEIVPGISLKKSGSLYEIVMYSSLGKELFDAPPVTLIDGVIIRNPTIVAGLNPRFVEKVEVVKEQYMVGNFIFDGIVNVITSPAGFMDIPLPENTVRIQYRIADPVYEFVSPDYSYIRELKNNEPDFRNTLLWNPALKTGGNGNIRIEFNSSDQRGDYGVTIQGISSTGRAVSIHRAVSIGKKIHK